MSISKNKNLFEFFVKNYWNYYVELEEQLLQTKKYVAFDSVNFKTYSPEYLKLLEVICSEIDIVAKEIAHQINPDFKIDNGNIAKWWFEIQDWFQEEQLEPIKMITDELSFSPWQGFKIISYQDAKGVTRLKHFDGSKTPDWWNAYTKVKHCRTMVDSETNEQNFKKANLKNVLHAISALYLLEKRFLMSVGTDVENSKIKKSNIYEKETIHFFYDSDGNICYSSDDEDDIEQ